MKSNTFDKEFFDRPHDRRNSGAIKYSKKIIGDESADIIPMWIADMDFESPPAVVKALTDAAAHSIYGYTDAGDDYDSIICSWYKRRLGWIIEPKQIIKVPGVLFGISSVIRSLTEKGDNILICQPVYYPFENVITSNGRKIVISELLLSDGRYRFDLDDFEDKIIKNNVKMFLLCSPHNPIGRVWTKDELLEVGKICALHNVIIVSDEIHSDFIYPGYTHTPISSIPEFADFTVTCTSPTKTFNLAGLQSAEIVVSNLSLREKIEKDILATAYNSLNLMAVSATRAAYLHGDMWLDGLLKYLYSNIALLRSALPENNGISLINPEGTYLMWLDCRALGLDDTKLNNLFLKEAKIMLHRGSKFGKGGSGFMRMNIACPSAQLLEAAERIKNAVK